MEITKVKEKLGNLKSMVERFRKDSRSFDEENTKMSLIIPFFIQLGYNTYDPYEFTSELLADCRTNGSDKVDYSILVNGEPKVIIEAKRFNTPLEPHIGQLARYFNVKPTIRYGILTNGTDYYFFTDTEHKNLMDAEPFYRLNIENVSDLDLDFLKHFAKDSIFGDDDALKDYIVKGKLSQYLKGLLENPTDAFIDFIKEHAELKSVKKEDVRAFYVAMNTKPVEVKPQATMVTQPSIAGVTMNPTVNSTVITPQASTPVMTTPNGNVNSTQVIGMDVELLGHKFTTKKWVDLFIRSFEILIQANPNVMKEMDKRFPKQKVTKFSYNINDFPVYANKLHATQLSNGLYVFTKLSASSIEGILSEVIEICGFSKDVLKVTKHLKDGTTV